PSKYSGSVAGRNADSVLSKLFSGGDLAKPRLTFSAFIRAGVLIFGGLHVHKTLVVFFVLICYHLNVYANERYSKN
ncbi:MAG TPA: hypothetical protein VI981_00930, partial [Candidatus Paceibacterota bacterium]